MVVVALFSGVFGGYVASMVARQARRAGNWLAALAFVYVGLASLGDWGHMFQFFWSWILGLLGIGGVIAGSRIRARQHPAGE